MTTCASTTTQTTHDLLPDIIEPSCNDELVLQLLQQYPPNAAAVSYGTAGFRFDATILPTIMVRVGITAVLRSLTCRAAVGVMVTASHNEELYNGVKIADPDGGMMKEEGEALVVTLVNEPNAIAVWQQIQELREQYNHHHNHHNNHNTTTTFVPVVHVGMDTRPHSAGLSDLVVRAVSAMGGRVMHHGVVTTPMLHHVVRHSNARCLPLLIPPRPNVVGYYELLTQSYQALVATNNNYKKNSPLEPWTVDAACGVGYAHLQLLHRKLQQLDPTAGRLRPIRVVNAPSDGPLNQNCGSEHVQKALQLPTVYNNNNNNNNNSSSSSSADFQHYAASVDGDADRIVFFYADENQQLVLLDGDKIACLICSFLQDEYQVLSSYLLQASTTLSSTTTTSTPHLRLGVVQTAYANGASTAFLQSIFQNNNNNNNDHESRVVIAKTGVKHVHHAAVQHFDVGVYFEANGHGTIVFGSAFYRYLQHSHDALLLLLRSSSQPSGTAPAQADRAWTALHRLSILPSLVNQAVGDALSDLLLVDAILQLRGWTLREWNGLYQDLPSRQAKIKVPDRTMIQTNDNETVCREPAALQTELYAAMQQHDGRAFVRPSGTEDVVRVYAEAPTRVAADALATQAAEIVYRWCHGTDSHGPPVF